MYYHEDNENRSTLTRRICILGWITLIISIICIVLGIVSVSVSESQADFPFSAGGAMVGGISALILSCCPIYLYCEENRSQGSYTTGCFDCCILLMVIWFSIAILAVCFSFGVAGIYAVVVCTNEEEKLKVCSSATGTKLAISVVTIIATLILFFLSLAIFFTCCCNAAKFGMPILETSYSHDNYNFSTERSRDMRRQQDIAIQALSGARTNPLRAREDHTISASNMSTEGPSAPNISDFRQHRSEISLTVETRSTSANFPSMAESRYSDPPPSYEEVMKKEETVETAI